MVCKLAAPDMSESSRPGELPPGPLTEPDLNLSTHPALD